MSRRPHLDPLGATPLLPAPDGPRATEVSRLFRRWVATRQRDEAPLPVADVPTRSHGSSRRSYPLAESKVAPCGQVPPPTQPSEIEMLLDAADEVTQIQSAPMRPPLGAPTVRPPVRRTEAAIVDQAALATLADTALLVHEPDGTTAFDIAFDDAKLPGVSCRIAVRQGKVVAVFHAPDRNTRWLLEGEADRLRADLEARGLRVEAVTVDDGEA